VNVKLIYGSGVRAFGVQMPSGSGADPTVCGVISPNTDLGGHLGDDKYVVKLEGLEPVNT
jgi:hypothetical protein